nr:hypothetical protein [Ereboglobus luteus]
MGFRMGNRFGLRDKRRILANVIAPIQVNAFERGFNQFFDTVEAACRENKIINSLGLKHPPHALHVFLGVNPVAFGRRLRRLPKISVAAILKILE